MTVAMLGAAPVSPVGYLSLLKIRGLWWHYRLGSFPERHWQTHVLDPPTRTNETGLSRVDGSVALIVVTWGSSNGENGTHTPKSPQWFLPTNTMYSMVLSHLLQTTLLGIWFMHGEDYNVAVSKLATTSEDRDNAGVLQLMSKGYTVLPLNVAARPHSLRWCQWEQLL